MKAFWRKAKMKLSFLSLWFIVLCNVSFTAIEQIRFSLCYTHFYDATIHVGSQINFLYSANMNTGRTFWS